MDQYRAPNRLFISKRFVRIPPPSEVRLPNGAFQNAGNNALAFYVINK